MMKVDIDGQAEAAIAGLTKAVVRRLGPVLRRGDLVAVEGPLDDEDYDEPCFRVTLQRGSVAYVVTKPGAQECCDTIIDEMERQLSALATAAVSGRMH